jgi:STE24 endopeptidase
VTPNAIFVLWLCLFAIEQAWLWLLAGLNLRHVRRHASEIPPAFAGTVDPGTRARSVAYTLERGRFGLFATLVSAAITVTVVTTGLLGALDAACARLPLGPYLRGVIFLFAVSLGSWLAGLPFSLYATFSIEARFGFNRTTPKIFALDTLKNLAVSVAIGLPVLLGLFWFMDRAGRWWWVWAFFALTAFELVMTLVYPLVIAPLFNKFAPLPEGTLRERILALAERLAFRTKGIFVMDASRRSRHGNAYFTGLGPVTRIVLFDTLVSTMSEDEVLAVLAHEIGHERRHHVRKGLALSIVLGLAGFWLLSLIVPWEALYRAFGFDRASSHAILVVLALASGPVTFAFRPLFSLWSRRHEREADRFAVDATGGAGAMVSALVRLSKDNLSNLTPHPWYSFYHYSHPTTAERVAGLEAYAAKRTSGAGTRDRAGR